MQTKNILYSSSRCASSLVTGPLESHVENNYRSLANMDKAVLYTSKIRKVDSEKCGLHCLHALSASMDCLHLHQLYTSLSNNLHEKMSGF